MSDSERPEIIAFRDLEQLVRHLGDELAGFRRRALLAESRLKEFDSEERAPDMTQQVALDERITELEHENAVLRARLESATERTRQMLERVRFIRQQAQKVER
jgi:predicted  nucleic acid-binding Zn-ribbon protein